MISNRDKIIEILEKKYKNKWVKTIEIREKYFPKCEQGRITRYLNEIRNLHWIEMKSKFKGIKRYEQIKSKENYRVKSYKFIKNTLKNKGL